MRHGKIVNDAVLFSSIELITGFQAWRRLRQDQGLSPKDALNVVRHTIDSLLAGK